MLIWGNGAFKTWANSIFVWNYPVPELHNIDQLGAAGGGQAVRATRDLRVHLPVVTGTGMLIAAIISGFLMGVGPGRLIGEYGRHHQAVRDLAINDLGDAGDRHADEAVRVSATPIAADNGAENGYRHAGGGRPDRSWRHADSRVSVPIASIAEIVISEIAHSLMVRPYSPISLPGPTPHQEAGMIAAISMPGPGERQVGELEDRALRGRLGRHRRHRVDHVVQLGNG